MKLALLLLWLPYLFPSRKWSKIYIILLTLLNVLIRPLNFSFMIQGTLVGVLCGLLYLPVSLAICNIGLSVSGYTLRHVSEKQLVRKGTQILLVVFCEEIVWRWVMLDFSLPWWVLWGFFFVIIHYLYRERIILINVLEMGIFTFISFFLLASSHNIWLCIGFHFIRNFSLFCLRKKSSRGITELDMSGQVN